MNILLVDDDVYVTEVLQKSIDWVSLQIENVYVAHSVNNAKKVMNTVPIHILISDIEMPKKSGFELLTWISEEKYIIKSILLTSYAEFEYANRAIKLNCFAYALKPINFGELEAIIQQAIEAEREALKFIDYKKRYIEINQSEKIRKEQFWGELLLKNSLNKQSPIPNIMFENEEEYLKQDLFLPIYIDYFVTDAVNTDYRKGMFDWNLKNMISDSFTHKNLSLEATIPIKEQQYFAMIKVDHIQKDMVLECSYKHINKVHKKVGVDTCITIGKLCNFENVIENMQKFLAACKRKIKIENEVIQIDCYKYNQIEYQSPNLQLWEEFISNNQEQALIKEIENYLEALVRCKKLDKEVLNKFILEYIQMLFSVLKKKNITLHNIEKSFFSLDTINESLRSVASTKKCLKEMAHVIIDLSVETKGVKSIVEKVKDYINQNLEENITREYLSQLFFINEDYLSRVFKKEYGVSIGKYINNKRMEVAKEYLQKTNEPVNTIAVKVGFYNFSYFSKVFKNSVGVTPKEYRQDKKARKIV